MARIETDFGYRASSIPGAPQATVQRHGLKYNFEIGVDTGPGMVRVALADLDRSELEAIAHTIAYALGGSLVYPPSAEDRAYFEQDGDYHISDY